MSDLINVSSTSTPMSVIIDTGTPKVNVVDLSAVTRIIINKLPDGTIILPLELEAPVKQTPAGGYTSVFNAITSGIDKMIAVGADMEVQSSFNGIDWSNVTGTAFPNIFYGANYSADSGLYTITGAAHRIHTSPSGNSGTWTERFAGGFGNYNCVSSGNNVTIIGSSSTGKLERSTDGINYSEIDTSEFKAFTANAYGSNIFIMSATDAFRSSMWGSNSTGSSWAALTNLSDPIYGMTYIDGTNFLAVGEDGSIYVSDPTYTNWSKKDNANGYTGTFYAASYGAMVVMAVGSGGEIQYSLDKGDTWIHLDNAGGYSGTFRGVTFYGNISSFVAVGDNGEIQTIKVV